MKKILSLLLVMSLLCGLTACGNKPTDEKQDNQTTQTESNENKENESTVTDPTKTDEPEVNDQPLHTYWGVEDKCGVEVNGLTEMFYINMPYYGSFNCGYGKAGEHFDINDPDGLNKITRTYMQGQHDSSPKVDDISKVLPAYFEEMTRALESLYGGMFTENFKMEISKDEALKVGEYDMHKFVGMIEFDNRLDGHYDFPFVAYATTLKSNGGYAFWMVYDPSPDHTLGDLIEEQAYNMAQTFRETK